LAITGRGERDPVEDERRQAAEQYYALATDAA
ncbi:MAG: hypothetical protein QOJ19_2528, partial [Acidimicrobiia bacterium]|nr:hypothetical protein [Acidimicrobiia bacterium]